MLLFLIDGRDQEKATPATRCGKCNGLGHFTYQCTGQREYKVRPTRTQILNNPKLQTKLTASLPPQMEIPTYVFIHFYLCDLLMI